jgi:hypothetical protein
MNQYETCVFDELESYIEFEICLYTDFLKILFWAKIVITPIQLKVFQYHLEWCHIYFLIVQLRFAPDP